MESNRGCKQGRCYVLIIALSILLTACGGGGGDNNPQAAVVSQGVFIDAAIEGIRFETPTQSGLTDAAGTFNYQAGEVVKFYIGDILLGSASGTGTLTPIDLVAGAVDETHPQVTNILRFVQSLDNDSNLTNGILISAATRTALAGQILDFSASEEDFETAFDLLNGTVLGGGFSLVSATDAQAHMSTTLETLRLGSLTISGVDTAVMGTSFAPRVLGVGTSGSGGAMSVIWSGINDGSTVAISALDGQLVMLQLNVVISTQFYIYNISCWPVAAADCSKITLNVGAKQLTLNNVTLEKVASVVAANQATGPITLNGALNWE